MRATGSQDSDAPSPGFGLQPSLANTFLTAPSSWDRTPFCTTGPDETEGHHLTPPAGGRAGVQPAPSMVRWPRVGTHIRRDETVARDELLATGTGLAVQTAAVPARADFESHGGATRRGLRPGSPVTNDGHLMRRDGGSRASTACRMKSCASRTRPHGGIEKPFAVRRRFAPAKPVRTGRGIEGRRDGNASDVCPRHTRATEGKTQLPQALGRPFWRTLQVR